MKRRILAAFTVALGLFCGINAAAGEMRLRSVDILPGSWNFWDYSFDESGRISVITNEISHNMKVYTFDYSEIENNRISCTVTSFAEGVDEESPYTFYWTLGENGYVSTSKTGENGNLLYYEYDSEGHLIEVRKQDGDGTKDYVTFIWEDGNLVKTSTYFSDDNSTRYYDIEYGDIPNVGNVMWFDMYTGFRKYQFYFDTGYFGTACRNLPIKRDNVDISYELDESGYPVRIYHDGDVLFDFYWIDRDVVSVDQIEEAVPDGVRAIYRADGTRVECLQPGFNIVVRNSGAVEKVMH